MRPARRTKIGAYIPFDGEREDHEWTEVLRRVEDDWKRLAQAATVEHADTPRRLQLEDEMQRQEEEVGAGERGQVAAGRVAHARLDPDGERQQVAGEADRVPDDGEVAVERRHGRQLALVERLHRLVRKSDDDVGRRHARVAVRRRPVPPPHRRRAVTSLYSYEFIRQQVASIATTGARDNRSIIFARRRQSARSSNTQIFTAVHQQFKCFNHECQM